MIDLPLKNKEELLNDIDPYEIVLNRQISITNEEGMNIFKKHFRDLDQARFEAVDVKIIFLLARFWPNSPNLWPESQLCWPSGRGLRWKHVKTERKNRNSNDNNDNQNIRAN